jgi:hypothetical protein
MANGELCKHCGDQETPHDFREYALATTCESFESEVTHHKKCPVIDCNGNCALTIHLKNRLLHAAAEHERRRFENAWFLGTNGNIVIIDIGS